MASRRRSIPENVQTLVRKRANGLCEYCHTIEKWQYVRFTVDHITPLSQDGSDDEKNLALACFHCNRRKSNHSTATDPQSGLPFDLFNPCLDIWAEHFVWSMDGTLIIVLTPTGCATVAQLQLNRSRIINIRLADAAIGRHPPQDDPIMATSE